jgi:hypothetical protein
MTTYGLHMVNYVARRFIPEGENFKLKEAVSLGWLITSNHILDAVFFMQSSSHTKSAARYDCVTNFQNKISGKKLGLYESIIDLCYYVLIV